MIPPTQRYALSRALSTREPEDVLQLLLQLRAPVRVSSLFVLNHKDKTARLRAHKPLVAAAIQAIDEMPHTMDIARRYTFWMMMCATSVFTLWTIRKNRKEWYEQYTLQGTAFQMLSQAKLVELKESLGLTGKWIPIITTNTLDPTRMLGNFVTAKLNAVALNLGEDALRSGYKGWKQLESKVYNDDAKERFEENKNALLPAVYGIGTLVLVLFINRIARVMLRAPDYVKYVRRMAQHTSADNLSRYRGAYDGCLSHIDDHLHELFGATDELRTANLHYLLLTHRGDRRALKLHHLVRTDGSLRKYANEMAHAIAAPESWTMRMSDTVHGVKRWWTRKKKQSGGYGTRKRGRRA